MKVAVTGPGAASLKIEGGATSSNFSVLTIKSGEAFASGVVFFPMHRVERIELDLPESNILSLAQRFAQQTGQDPAPLLTAGFLARTGGEE